MIRKIFKNFKKNKTENFEILVQTIENIQILIIECNNIIADIEMSVNLKEESEIIEHDNFVRKKLSQLYKKITALYKTINVKFKNNNPSNWIWLFYLCH